MQNWKKMPTELPEKMPELKARQCSWPVFVEAAWLSGYGARFEIHRSWVQIQFWPLADVVLGSHEFNSYMYACK